MEIPAITITYPAWVNAKAQRLRELYERAGFTVVERPGEEEFPFEVDFFPLYRPAILAHRGGEHHVVEVRERTGSIRRLMERFDDIRGHPHWYVHLVTGEDVVEHDVPEVQRELRAWHELERSVEETLQLAPSLPAWVQLLALWALLEGVLRRMARDDRIPVEMLPAPSLIARLHNYGLLPYESYEPLQAAHETHRRVRHGYHAPDEDVTKAVSAVAEWLPALLPTAVERAA